jgi:hypothetical protein
MGTENILILVNLLTTYAGKMAEYFALISKARAEGRDVSRDELQALLGKDDVVAAELQALIEAK